MEGEGQMKVKYSHAEGVFSFIEGDKITIVVHFLYVNDTDEDLYHHGTLTKVEKDGFWCVLEDDKTKEEYFSFADVENVVSGDRIPFLSGTTRRPDSKITFEKEALEHVRQIAVMKGISEQEAIAVVVNVYADRHAQLIKRAHISAERAMKNYDK